MTTILLLIQKKDIESFEKNPVAKTLSNKQFKPKIVKPKKEKVVLKERN